MMMKTNLHENLIKKGENEVINLETNEIIISEQKIQIPEDLNKKYSKYLKSFFKVTAAGITINTIMDNFLTTTVNAAERLESSELIAALKSGENKLILLFERTALFACAAVCIISIVNCTIDVCKKIHEENFKEIPLVIAKNIFTMAGAILILIAPKYFISMPIKGGF